MPGTTYICNASNVSTAFLQEVWLFGQVFTSHFAVAQLQGTIHLSCVFLSDRTDFRCLHRCSSKQFTFSNDARSHTRLCVDLRLAIGNPITLTVFRFCGLHSPKVASDPDRFQ